MTKIAPLAPPFANRNAGGEGGRPIPIRPELVPHVPEEPTPLVHEPEPAKAFPIEALGPLRDAADAIHDMTQAPAAIAAQAVLGVAALAVQGIADVETLGSPAPCSLFLLTVAGSGERKSACDRLAMRAVEEFERELAVRRADEKTVWKNRHAIWDAGRKGILAGKAADKEKATAREADLADLGAEPEGPRLPMVTTGDPTVEGIVKNMGQLRPSLGIFSAEGGAFLGGAGMTQENRLKTAATISSFWDGSPVSRLRAGDGASMFHGRRVSAHLMAQPVAATTLLADPVANGQGLLARFLTVWPTSTIGTRTRFDHSEDSDAALRLFGDRIGALLRRPLAETPDGGVDPRLLRLSPAARRDLEDLAEEVELAQARGAALERIRPFASKAAEHACRLAAVMTLYGDPEAEEVREETMRDAILLVRFYLSEALRLAGETEVSAETAEAERLRRWLVESWPEPFVSVTEAVQRGPLRDGAKVGRAFARLAQAGWLLPAEEPVNIKGMTRRRAWRIVRP